MPIDLAIPGCLSRPTAIGLERAYQQFGEPNSEGRAPCRRSRDAGVGGPRVRNQCAVRMSVALCRSMNDDIFGAYEGGALHSARCCAGAEGEKYRHISSSQTLFEYLRNTLGFEFSPVTNGAASIPQPGILFFQNIQGFRNGVGDHIDFWNGRTYFNEASGAGAPTGRLPLFRRATRVFYCRL